MITHRKKQYHKAMEPPEKNIFMEKKQFRDMKSKQEIQKENSQKYETMDTVYSVSLGCISLDLME